MKRRSLILLLSLLVSTTAAAQWKPQTSGTTAGLRGLSVVSPKIAWAGGTGGTVLRTTDGGASWMVGSVSGAEALDFRDVEAFDAQTAYVMSAGEGDRSRIYKTTDGGRTWTLQHTNPGPQGFFDSFAFWDERNGIVMSDPVDGRFLLLVTTDGGRTWTPVTREALPPALPGEAAFAASGTALVVEGQTNVWFATGGGPVSRVFRSTDRGRTWSAAETPIAAGSPTAGIFSLAFADGSNGVAVGGDYKEPGGAGINVALTSDGGRTWRAPSGARPSGYRSGVAYLPGTRGETLVAVGTTGSDISRDGGRSWTRLDTTNLNAVQFADDAAGFAVGADGRIARIVLPPK